MNEAELRKIIEATPLAADANEIMALVNPATWLNTSPMKDDDLAAGVSRLGGLPNLPPDVAWPVDDGRPLDFIAQIDLAQAAEAMHLQDMPVTGWLAFFYDADYQPWGFDPRDRGGWRVLFFQGEATALRRVEPPEPVAPSRQSNGLLAQLLGRKARPAPPLVPFQPQTVRFEPIITLPNLFNRVDVDANDTDRFFAVGEIMDSLTSDHSGPEHQWGGHPAESQGDMKLECQLVSNGLLFMDGLRELDSPRGRALAAGAEDWQLLLQIDSDKEAGWMWGDAGQIFFWIRRQDLVARDFDKVWCVLQCG